MAVTKQAISFEELQRDLSKKVELLQICCNLKENWGEDTVNEIIGLKELLQEYKNKLLSYKEAIHNAQNNMHRVKTVLSHLKNLSFRMSHMNSNLPEYVSGNVKKKYKLPFSQIDMNLPEDNINPKNVKVSKNEPELKRSLLLNFISLTEFELIPKYARGRLQYEQVNNAITEINKALQLKYNLLSKHRSKLTLAEMKLVSAFKNHETKETKGLHFVTEEDIKRWTSLKFDAAGRSILTILRTAQMLRMIKGPGNLTRYVII